MRRLVIAGTLAVLVVCLAVAAGAQQPPRLDGEWIVVAHQNPDAGIYDIVLIRPDGSEMSNLTNGAAEDTGAELSPDGTAIAFGSYDPDSAYSIQTMSVDGTHRRVISDRYGNDPTWTPDGRSIVFARYEELLAMDRNGANVRTIATVAGGTIRNPTVSPDGTTVVFDSYDGDSRQLYSVPIDGGEPTQLTADGGFEAEWSPDGTRILFTSFRDEYGDNMHVMNPDGSDQVVFIPSVFNDFHASWSPDGMRVVYESVRGDFAITIFDVAAGTYTDLLTTPDADTFTYRRPTWSAVTLPSVCETEPAICNPVDEGAADPSTTTVGTEAVTVPTSTAPIAVPATTAPAATAPGPPSGTDRTGLVVSLAGAILVLSVAGIGIAAADRRRRSSGHSAPPPAH